MKVHRTYGNDGNLLAYTITPTYTIKPTAHNRHLITKEMATRARRYKKQSRRTALLNTLAPFIISLTASLALAGWYLINN